MIRRSRPILVNSRRQKPSWSRIMNKQAREFCLNTGLHGYKYMGHIKRTRAERLVWGTMVFVALSCAIVLMHTAWEYNSSRSTLTVIKSTHRGIWNYPFPAITVCNLNRVSRNKAQELVKNLIIPENMTDEYVVHEMKYLLELLEPGIFGSNPRKNLQQLQSIFDLNNISINEVMKQVSQDCSNLITDCKWKGSVVPCKEIIHQSVSREGHCCSFNYTSPFISSTHRNEEFQRISACGYQTGLTIAVNPEADDYLASILGSYGIKIRLHYPYDYPDHNAISKLVGMGYQVFLSVSPIETYSNYEVRKLPITTRKCIFNDETNTMTVNTSESKIKFFSYSYINCLTACRAEIIYAACGCIPYYYQQERTIILEFLSGSRVCSLIDVGCLKKHRCRNVNKDGITSTIMSENTDRPCDCSPDCNLYRYEVESSQSFLEKTKTYSGDMFLQNLNFTSQSTLHIFFSDLVSLQYYRNSCYNWRNLFASFGGLLGLFAGFSLMSAIELIYFFAIRLISDSCTDVNITLDEITLSLFLSQLYIIIFVIIPWIHRTTQLMTDYNCLHQLFEEQEERTNICSQPYLDYEDEQSTQSCKN